MCEEVEGELVVYDQRDHRMVRLNRSAAVVWRACDGRRSPAELLAVVQTELGDVADDDVVAIALDQLAGHGLLQADAAPRPPRDTRESRRRFIRRVGAIGTAAAAIPLVYSVTAPTPAHAASTSTCTSTCGCLCPPCTCPCLGCVACICICVSCI